MTTNDDIAKRAYELWEKSGRPDGCHTEHWLKAEAELRSKQPAAAKPARKPRAKKAASRRSTASLIAGLFTPATRAPLSPLRQSTENPGRRAGR